jgi:hypothetical protein
MTTAPLDYTAERREDGTLVYHRTVPVAPAPPDAIPDTIEPVRAVVKTTVAKCRCCGLSVLLAECVDGIGKECRA